MSRNAAPFRVPTLSRLFHLVVVLCLLFTEAGATSPKDGEARRHFDIPAGPAIVTLKRAATQCGLEIFYSASLVRGVTTRPVIGEFSPHEALERLVAETPLTIVRDLQTGVLSVVRRTEVEVPEAPPSSPPKEPQRKMTPKNHVTLLATLFAYLTSPGAAQDGAAPAKNEVVTLSPFEVSTERDDGYRASNSLGATRANVAIRDLPMNIVVANRELIEDIGALDLGAVVEYMGGVSRIGGTNEPRYSLRGFVSSSMMRNGLRTRGPSDGNPEAVGVERIEIIKGPAAILYGISEPGGVINYISSRPIPGRNFVNLGLMAGTFDILRATVDANGQASDGKPFYYRVEGAYSEQGFGDRFFFSRGASYNAALSWRPRAGTSLTLTVNNSELERGRTGGQPSYRTTDGRRLLFLDRLPFEHSRFPSWARTEDENLFLEMEALHRVSDALNFRLFATRNVSSSRTLQGAAGADVRKANGGTTWAPGEDPLTGWHIDNTIDTNDKPNRVGEAIQAEATYRFQTRALQHQLLLGYELFHSHETRWVGPVLSDAATAAALSAQFSKVRLRVASDGRLLVTSPAFDPTAEAERNQLLDALGGRGNLRVRAARQLDLDLTTNAFFLNHQVTFGPAERTRLMAGVRYDDFDNRDLQPNAQKISRTKKASPQFGVSHRLNETFTVYSLYSRSITPNITSQPNAPSVTPLADGSALPPEYGDGLDLGLKFERWGGRLAGTVALFTITRENIVRTHPDLDLVEAVERFTGGATLLSPGGKERNRGVEFDFTIRPARAWQIYGGATWLADSEVLSSSDSAIIGQPVQFSRRLTASVWNRVNLNQNLSLSFGVVHMSQSRRTNFDNGEGAFTTVQAGIGYNFTLQGIPVTLNLQCKNALDEYYIGVRDTQAMPRNWLLTARFKL